MDENSVDPVETVSANSVEFREIRPQMNIEDLIC